MKAAAQAAREFVEPLLDPYWSAAMQGMLQPRKTLGQSVRFDVHAKLRLKQELLAEQLELSVLLCGKVN